VSDASLVRRVWAGEEAAFDEFFALYFPRLYRFAIARLNGNEDASEEVVQRTLIRGIDRLHTFKGDASLLTWLCTICRHEISDWIAREGRGRAISLSEEQEVARLAIDSLAAADIDQPDAALRRSEVSRLVHSALDHLPDRYGDALKWKYLEELPVEQIAGRLGVGHKAAESLLTRARAAFRDSFSRVAGGWPTASGTARSREEP
jgi:RNA polymerase sigma-70 factor (ECF subfamily)